MTELAPAFAISAEELIKKYHDPILRMITHELESDVEHERLTQVAIALRNILYMQSKQYVFPRYDRNNGSIEWVQATDNGAKARFMSVYNIVESDGAKFVGAVSPRAPNAKVLPDDDESEDEISAARNVDGLLRILYRKWNANRLQKELAWMAWTTGPIFGLTSYTADGHRFGWTEEPEIEIEEQPGPFGESIPVPRVVGTKRYPKGDVDLTLASVLYVTIPFKSKTLAEAPYLRYEYMEHKSLLKAIHGEKLKDEKFDHRSGSASSTQETAARAQHQQASPSGSISEDWAKNRWHYCRYWIRPALYSLVEGDCEDVETGEKRKLSKVLEDQFPDGLKIVLVNAMIVDLVDERLDDVWSVCKTGKGERILESAWCNNIIPIQDDLNDFFNMGKEIILRSIPKTIVASDLIDSNRIEENDPEIAEVIRAKFGAGMDFTKMMAQFPMSRMPDQLIPFAQFMRAVSREVGGVNEALVGGGVPSTTYRGEKQRRDQSMMQFAPFYDETQAFWEAAATNAIRQWIRFGSSEVKIPGEDGKGAITISPASLPETGWHVEAEEGLPMSHSEEVDRLMFLLNENNPEVIGSLGILSPTNAQQLYKMLGLRGFKAPQFIARNKAQQDIQRLLTEPPIMDTDPVTMQPIEMPSIPADEYDDPILFATIYQEWLLFSQQDKEQNPQGFSNVEARWREYDLKAKAMMLPPPGLPPGEGPPGEAPPELPPEMLPPQGPPGPPPPVPFDTAPMPIQ